jgi:hypothetical protein
LLLIGSIVGCNWRLAHHLLCQLLCLGRHTITGLLRTDGRIQGDWSGDYRLYSKDRVDPEAVFAVTRRQAIALVPAEQEVLVGAMDDSVARKRGRKIPGVAWRRDPLSPPFQVNFILGQRVLQTSLAVPLDRQGAAKMIPIDFVQAPTAQRPGPKATETQQQAYKEQQKQRNINRVAVQRMAHLQQWLLEEGEKRPLLLGVDNRLTNRTVLRGKPLAVRLVGRIRKDARLYSLPEASAFPRRIYGQALPTPEQIRQDKAIPWQEVRAYAAGKVHRFRVKVLKPVRWRGMGRQDLLLMIIAPLSYRLKNRGKLLYREPAYLICTQADADLAQVLQAYVWRWGIEVNFRDEKSLLGIGQAQVRNEHSVQNVPAVAVGAYGLLQLAALRAFGLQGQTPDVPIPAWLKRRPPHPPSTMALLQQLRHDCWARAIEASARTDFTSTAPMAQKSSDALPPLDSAVFCAIAG